MNYKIFYDKYIDKKSIFKEDLIFDFINLLDFSEEDAINIYKHLIHYNLDIEKHLSEEALQKTNLQSPNFSLFLNMLRNKQIVSKISVMAIENSYINLIDELTAQTNSYIIYRFQIHTIVKVIGSYFMWSDFKYSSVSSEYIKEYIQYNMRFTFELYPNLYNKLLSVIDNIDLESDDDYFTDFLTKSKCITNSKRELKKNENQNKPLID